MKELLATIEYTEAIVQSLVLLVLIILMLAKADRRNNVLLSAFYVFGLISLLMSDLYWIAYSFLRPGTRMPFAANEIGEGALFLLMGAALSYAFRENRKKAPEAFLSVVFVAINAALWYGWSGELFEDILTGVEVSYLFFVTVNSAKYTQAFKRMEWIAVGTGAFLLAGMQGLTFILPKGLSFIADKCCYVLMVMGACFFVLKTVNAVIRKKASPEQALCISWLAMGSMTIFMYMSAGFAYSAFLTLCTFSIICTYLAVRRLDERRAES
jgi:hypothetical protein